MSKKLKYILGTILSLMILGGCKEEMPSLGEASSTETNSETVTETSSAATTAVPAKIETETSTATSETTETTAEQDDVLDEKAALEKLILEAAEETNNPHAVSSSMFGDYDNDGKNECILVVDGYDMLAYPRRSVWFASGDKAERLVPFGNWFSCEIVASCGNTFIKIENRLTETSQLSRYFLLKNSSVTSYNNIIPAAASIYPDGEYG
ncbi:MAG: hypothetical protein K2N71_04600, partial [Oscillospiraceae bacterium]|nr:hypothetical protein [Oscillospiraceae bacterium]